MNEIIILSTIGFIFGWFTSKVSYKRKLIRAIKTIQCEFKSPNKHFTEGMKRGNQALQLYILSLIEEDKVGKNHSLVLNSKNDIDKNNTKD